MFRRVSGSTPDHGELEPVWEPAADMDCLPSAGIKEPLSTSMWQRTSRVRFVGEAGSFAYDYGAPIFRRDLLPIAYPLAVEWQELTGWLTLLYVLILGGTLHFILTLKRDSTSAVAWCMTVIFM